MAISPCNIKMDYREKFSGIIEELEKSSFPFSYELTHLKSGDYVIEDKILIERKTLTDFLESIKSGRLFDQAYRMTKSKKSVLFILEGRRSEINISQMSRNVIQGALIQLGVFLGIPVVRANDIKETVRLFSYIANQYFKNSYPRPKSTVVKVPHFSTAHAQRDKILLIQRIPGIGYKKAISLLDAFNTVEKIFTAEIKELKKVSGIGNRIANQIHQISHTPYKTNKL